MSPGRLQSRRRDFWIALVGGPVAMCIGLPLFNPKPVLMLAMAAGWFVWLAFTATVLMWTACPSCGRHFFVGESSRSILASRCRHCDYAIDP